MVDITEISAVVAAVGVTIGVVFTVLQLRDLVKTRQADLLMRMHLAFSSKEFSEATQKMSSASYKDYDEFVEKYGDPYADEPVPTAFAMMGTFFEGLGVLTKRKFADISLVADLFGVPAFWEKMKPLVEGMRKQHKAPKLQEWFEYLANEAKKYYQQQASKTA